MPFETQLVMACTVMAYIAMAYTVVAYVLMAYIALTYIIRGPDVNLNGRSGACQSSSCPPQKTGVRLSMKKRKHRHSFHKDILFYWLVFCFVGILQKPSGSYLRAAYICGVGYLMPTSAGVVQRHLLFVVVVHAGVPLFCCSCSNTSALFSAQR